ncbi:MAG: hypothetical protein J6S70_00060, partial [Clostridia bacterium]|nr:hypothetical protein [Clostridia bacterium]
LLRMHGGSFFIGNTEEKGVAGWCDYFASLGYVAVSINYRLGFRPSRADLAAAEKRALEDADAALRILGSCGENAYVIGRIKIAEERIVLC